MYVCRSHFSGPLTNTPVNMSYRRVFAIFRMIVPRNSVCYLGAFWCRKWTVVPKRVSVLYNIRFRYSSSAVRYGVRNIRSKIQRLLTLRYIISKRYHIYYYTAVFLRTYNNCPLKVSILVITSDSRNFSTLSENFQN